MDRWRAAAVLTGVALLWALLATRRSLSGDEAYYLCGARAGTPWPLADHPPLLGALLAATDRLRFLPVELRVRGVSIALQMATVVGLARAAAASAPATERKAAATFATVLGSLGLMPFAGALLTTPDAPMLCALAWILALSARPSTVATNVGLALLAALALLAKVAALPVLATLIAVRLVERRRLVAGALAAGALAALPWALGPLRLQLLHVLGRGPFVSAPHLGPLASASAFVVGQLLLWSPLLVWIAARALAVGHPGRDRAWPLVALVPLVAALASALVSGRPPEPNWGAPAGLVAILAVSCSLASDVGPGRGRWTVGLAAAPALVAAALWSSPLAIGPLARVPPPGQSLDDAPPYARDAWHRVYGVPSKQVDEIRAVMPLR